MNTIKKKTVYEIDCERGWKVCTSCKTQKNLKHFNLRIRHDGTRYRNTCYECINNNMPSQNKKEIYIFKEDKIYRICNTCKIEKKLEEFYPDKRKKYGKCGQCKTCEQERKSKYCKTESFKIRNRARLRSKEHAIWRRERDKIRRKTEPEYKIKRNIQRRIHHAIKDNYKSSKTLDLLGCSPQGAKIYIELRFKQGMSWDNYGTVWEIDHIIPCASFDLTNPEEQRKCFHYSNLQPLWITTEIARKYGDFESIGNMNKSDKII